VSEVDQLRQEVRRISTKALRAQVDSLDHGADLAGLADDDHTQYLNSSRHASEDHSGLGGDIIFAETFDLLDLDGVAGQREIVSHVATGLVAGDIIEVELTLICLNNTGATRVWKLDVDYDDAFGQVVSITCGDDTVERTFWYGKDIMQIHAANSASRGIGMFGSNTGVERAAGGDDLTQDRRQGWDTTTQDLTGSTIITVDIDTTVESGTAQDVYGSVLIRKVSSA
jgi:hypothetical protein